MSCDIILLNTYLFINIIIKLNYIKWSTAK